RLLWQTGHIDVTSREKIAIIGKNGSGKTTLMRKIRNEAAGVTTSPAVKIGYFSQNLDVLDVNKSILENVSNTSNQNETLIRTVLADRKSSGHIDVTSREKIAIIGKNGSGKTTLMRKIRNEAAGVTTSPAVKIGYFSQNLDVLDVNKSILENVSNTSNQNETLIRTVL